MQDANVDLWATDEVHFQQHGSRCRMWIPPEIKDPVLLHAPTRKSVGYFGAVRLRDGRFVFRLETGKFNGPSFLQFLQQLRSASRGTGRRVVVITDNARYHHSRLHRPWREQHAHHFALDFLPAYSPQLNPIERVWKLTRRRCLYIDVLPARLIGDRAYDSDPLDRRLERDYSIELIRPTGRTAIRPKTGASCDDTSDVGVSNGCLPGCSGSGD
jgi:transposase